MITSAVFFTFFFPSFFQQVYDEIEICPLNVYHVHLTKTENITDFGKFNQNISQEFLFFSLPTFSFQELSVSESR